MPAALRSESCFAKLLGDDENGRWLLAPKQPASVRRRYLPGTLILETTVAVESGTVRIIDFMPFRDGYEGSKPVRIGNAAHEQLQLDVYGELMDAIYQARRGGLAENERAWAVECVLLNHLAKIWRQPDHGIWEIREEPRQFTYSKSMAWVAFDRGIKSAEEFGMRGPVTEWKRLRHTIHRDVCRNGYDADRQTFVQAYGEPELDVCMLRMPVVGFLPPDDRRMLSRISAIERNLVVDGLVKRCGTKSSKYGFSPGEGVFLACSFWLVDAYHMTGRNAEARALLEKLPALRNDVGLLSEEYAPEARAASWTLSARVFTCRPGQRGASSCAGEARQEA